MPARKTTDAVPRPHLPLVARKVTLEDLSKLNIHWDPTVGPSVIESYMEILRDFHPGDYGELDTEGDPPRAIKTRLSRAATNLGLRLKYPAIQEDQNKVYFAVLEPKTARTRTRS